MFRPADFFACLVLILTLCLPGCGVKKWPEPRAGEDVFSWKSVTVTKTSNCLTIDSTLDGNAGNLTGIVLEIEYGMDLCRACPFAPNMTIPLSLDSPEVHRRGRSITVSHCRKDGFSGPLRFRLSGINVYPAIEPSLSRVHTVEDED
jgi:hypothetical protein